MKVSHHTLSQSSIDECSGLDRYNEPWPDTLLKERAIQRRRVEAVKFLALTANTRVIAAVEEACQANEGATKKRKV